MFSGDLVEEHFSPTQEESAILKGSQDLVQDLAFSLSEDLLQVCQRHLTPPALDRTNIVKSSTWREHL